MADLSLSKQCDIILKAEEVWNDSQKLTEMYTAEAESIKAMATQQADRSRIITQLEDPNLEADQIRVVWIDNCNDTLDDNCQDVCDFTGLDKGLASKLFNLNNCKSASFSVDENDLRRNQYSFDEYVARQLLSKTKALDEYLNLQGILFLSANAGYNSNPEGYTVAGDSVQIPGAEYNTELLVKMIEDAKRNYIKDAFVIDSGSLYRAFLLADLEKGNSDGDGSFRKKQLFNTYFDLVGFSKAAVTDTSFLISPHAYAFASRNYNPAEPTTYNPTNGWQQRYSMPSNNIPGLTYDIYYKYECSGKRFKHTWYIETNFAFLLNPEGCDIDVDGDGLNIQNRSGILSYTKN